MIAVYSIPSLAFLGSSELGDKGTDMAKWSAKLLFQLLSAFCVSVPGTKYQLYLFVDTPTIF